jgi:hypothetical protein
MRFYRRLVTLVDTLKYDYIGIERLSHPFSEVQYRESLFIQI